MAVGASNSQSTHKPVPGCARYRWALQCLDEADFPMALLLKGPMKKGKYNSWGNMICRMGRLLEKHPARVLAIAERAAAAAVVGRLGPQAAVLLEVERRPDSRHVQVRQFWRLHASETHDLF